MIPIFYINDNNVLYIIHLYSNIAPIWPAKKPGPANYIIIMNQDDT